MAPDRLNDAVIEVTATVEDQVARRGIIGKRFAQLLRYPCAGWMPDDIEMQNLTATVGNNEEAVEHAKGERRNCEEIHGRNRFPVVGQECRPPLCGFGISRNLPHPVQHCSFRDFEAEHLQLAMNPRRAPGGVLSNHSEDQFPRFLTCGSSSHAHPAPRNPLPVQLESRSMPTDNGFRLNNENRPLPA